MSSFALLQAYLLGVVLVTTAKPSAVVDPATTLECHRREYTFRAQKIDSLGRKCWGYINVMSCWGRCDSNEIADWKFPYKRSFHPVCVHAQRFLRESRLSHCDDDVEPGTDVYEYYEAGSCACQECRTRATSCEDLPSRSLHLK